MNIETLMQHAVDSFKRAGYKPHGIIIGTKAMDELRKKWEPLMVKEEPSRRWPDGVVFGGLPVLSDIFAGDSVHVFDEDDWSKMQPAELTVRGQVPVPGANLGTNARGELVKLDPTKEATLVKRSGWFCGTCKTTSATAQDLDAMRARAEKAEDALLLARAKVTDERVRAEKAEGELASRIKEVPLHVHCNHRLDEYVHRDELKKIEQAACRAITRADEATERANRLADVGGDLRRKLYDVNARCGELEMQLRAAGRR